MVYLLDQVLEHVLVSETVGPVIETDPEEEVQPATAHQDPHIAVKEEVVEEQVDQV